MSIDVESFERERRYLFAVAYRMLGSASEADDVVQEAWLRARAVEEEPRSSRAFLTTIVVRLCLDVAKSARARRETYVGPWLPEPIVGAAAPEQESTSKTPDDRIGIDESVSMALLVVLETLSPLERATFLLREVFDYEFEEVAACLGKNEAACRQLFHRAKKHVEEGRPRYKPTAADAERLVGGFLSAIASGDVESVASMLTEDCVATSDGGGRALAALKPIFGRDRTVRFLFGLTKKATHGLVPSIATVNGAPAVLLSVDGRIVTVIVLESNDQGINRIHIVSNPDKLAHLTCSSS